MVPSSLARSLASLAVWGDDNDTTDHTLETPGPGPSPGPGADP